MDHDGFSFIALCWLEALGFCAHGEGGPFVESGALAWEGGNLPTNTHGGSLYSRVRQVSRGRRAEVVKRLGVR